jgi:hypothetical protein
MSTVRGPHGASFTLSAASQRWKGPRLLSGSPGPFHCLKREAVGADASYALGKAVTAGRNGSPSPSLHGNEPWKTSRGLG